MKNRRRNHSAKFKVKVALAAIKSDRTMASLAGLLFAHYLDFSFGPAIGMFLGIALILAAFFRQCLSNSSPIT